MAVCRVICFLTGLLFLPASVAEPIRLAMPVFPPFTYEDEWGNPAGIGYHKTTELLDKAGIQYSITLVPNYGRAVAEVRSGQTDGFFLASQNNERDQIAIFSGAIMANPWSWYSRQASDTNFCQQTIATIINTNTHRWLMNQGCPKIRPVHNAEELVYLLLKAKVDTVFVSQAVMRQALNNAGLPASHFHQQVELVKAFGLYLSRDTHQRLPHIMMQLKQAIAAVK